MKKNRILCLLAVFLFSVSAAAFPQQEKSSDYQRSSLYTMLLKNTNTFSDDIRAVFLSIPMPDKFNDHNLSVRIAPVYAVAQEEKDKSEAISQFIYDNGIARRMVAKWFLRDKKTGLCSMDEVISRGLYAADRIDEEIAMLSKRGTSILEDSGIDLIGNTFLLVHDIQYIDKERNAKVASQIFNVLGAIAGAVAEASGGAESNVVTTTASMVESVADIGSLISTAIAGFTVNTTSYLYQLKWTDEEFATFSDYYWADSTMNAGEILSRKEAFERSMDDFRLTYVGSFSATSQKTVLRGLHTNEDVIRKVCARSIDKNIVELQRKFEPFRVKVPVLDVGIAGERGYVSAYIGKKEGVSMGNRYEVLEKRKDKEGRVFYRKVGIVTPVQGKIWDNRFMAREEQAEGADLEYTLFRTLSGRGFYRGMLLREVVR